MLSLLHNIYKLRSKADVELLVAIFWVIWSVRNKFIFKGKRENPQVLVVKAEAVAEAYKRTQIPMLVFAGDQQSITQRTWSPPKSGYCKVNVDATTNLEKKISGLWAVIRDELGKVIAAAIKPSKFNGDVTFVDVEAMEWGLQIAG